jgi:hypothetical protein
MKTALTIAAILITVSGCTKPNSAIEEFGDYVVAFPAGFQKFPSPSPDEVIWATQDRIVEIISSTVGQPISDSSSLPEFTAWISTSLGLSNPNFFRAANGFHVALNTSEESTLIVIVYPNSTDRWTATTFSVSGAYSNDHRLRETRELAIAAILGGRLTAD